jgi:mRNA deadenylase 3'-5' endonuclease subunit Ccr4
MESDNNNNNYNVNVKINNNKSFPFNYRNFIPNIEQNKIENILKDKNKYIRVIQYNILCDSLLSATTKLTEESIKKFGFYNWDNRKKKLFEELKNLNGDLIGLEEFERDENFIKQFNEIGYELLFKPRTGEHSEGCALLYKENKFNLIEVYSLNFNMNVLSDKDQSEIYNRDNVALFGIFNLKSDENCIIICCVSHILFNLGRGDIKLGQIYQIFQTFQIFKEKYVNKNIFIFLLSDLNAIPKSGVYKLITTGELDCNKINKYKLSGQEQGNLQYISPPTKVKSFLLNKITSFYTYDISKENNNNINNNKYFNSNENIRWFNEICRINPIIKENKILLQYKEKYIYKDTDLILKLPFKMESAYSKLARKIFLFLSENKNNELPLNLIDNKKIIDNIEVNGIKMGFNEIKKTSSFVKKLTLDLPMSFYANNSIGTSDYIFYYSENNNLDVVRILNIPNIFDIVFDIGFMPNEIFPSDHLSLCADFVITN